MAQNRDSFFLADKKTKEKKYDKSTYKKQKKFDENREGLKETEVKEKKPFDKKAYRLKKYSKKYKLEQWEEQRKKRMLHNYQKELKKDPMSGTYKAKVFDEDTSPEVGKFVKHPDLIDVDETDSKLKKRTPKSDAFHKAKEHYNKIKQEKQNKLLEKEKAQEEKKKKLAEYKKKKQERYKKLSKKTKKGQPVMTGRLEMLLEKIQKK